MTSSINPNSENISSISMLKHQIQQLHYTVQIKDRKISYLQSQIKSTKAQQLKKIQVLENSFNQLKKQNHTFIRKSLQQKKIQNDQFEEKIMKLYEENKTKMNQKEKFYQRLLKDKQQKYQSTIKNMETRYEQIVAKIKQQNKVLQNLLLQKKYKHEQNIVYNQQIFTFNNQDYKQYLSLSQQPPSFQFSFNHTKPDSTNSLFLKQKMAMMQQLITSKKKYQKIKSQLEMEKKINKDLQNEKRNMKMQFEEQSKTLKRQIQILNQKILSINQNTQSQKTVYLQKIMQLEQMVEQYKYQLKQFNQNYLQALTNRASNTEREIPVKNIKTCNHQGLIMKLEENLALKNSQIQDLRLRMSEWQKMLGLGKSFDQRLKQIGNISDRSHEIYSNQKANIKKKAQGLRKN